MATIGLTTIVGKEGQFSALFSVICIFDGEPVQNYDIYSNSLVTNDKVIIV